MQSSNFTVEPAAQKDGRSYVREVHVDAAGRTIEMTYLAAAGTNYAAILAAHAAAIDAQLADSEFDQVLNGP